MSESLRNDGRVWVSQRCSGLRAHEPHDISEDARDYLRENIIALATSLRVIFPSRSAKEACDDGRVDVTEEKGLFGFF